MELALQTLRNHDLIRLLSNQKLRLVLDLDHTLLHALGISRLNQQERDHLLYEDGCRPHQHHYFGEGSLYNIRNLLIKLRPYIKTFLKEASELFELCIYTMGDRRYASTVIPILDPEGSYFGKNVLTREDCTTPGQKGLDVLLSHERATLIIDDTYTVWELHPRNLILIAPYRFFADSSHPNRLSWSEFHKDESEVRGEFARILKVLRKVHGKFYDTREGDRLWKKDVRVVMEEIRKESPKLFKLSSVPGACEPESNEHGCGNLINMLSNLSLSSDSSEVTNQHQPILFGF